MKEIRIGLLGFGAMGKTHLYAVNNLPFYYKDLTFSARVTSLVTAHKESAQRAASLYAIPHTAESEEEIINDPTLDAIDICTPNIFHYDTVCRALRAGKHVYCEKPLSVTYAQAREMAELAQKSGKTVQIVFNNRFMGAAIRARRLIEEGRLGRIISFRGEYLHTSAIFADRPIGWKQNRDICGGGVLFDLGSHVIDMIYYLCGRFASVVGASQIAFPRRVGSDGQPWETNADEAFYMLARLENGAMGTIEVSKVAAGSNDDLKIEVRGEKGALRFSLMDPNFLYFYDATREDGVLGGERGYQAIECVGRYPAPGGSFPGMRAPVGWLRGHVGSMYSFLSAVAEGREASPSFEDGAHVQWVMEQAYKNDISAKDSTGGLSK
ncbi:MAG: Gfo/Idh/MocA family oxidoreductase [Clostridia bacterium]|nr:Gfo/Idh/MocA family oxidoreductase [Clostridia bacterium]